MQHENTTFRTEAIGPGEHVLPSGRLKAYWPADLLG